MNKFTLVVNSINIAQQIADMLNTYNKLCVVHTGHTILTSSTHYIIEKAVINNTLEVVGCVGISPTNQDTTLIKHLCVKKEMRGMGIAGRLINIAIANSSTNYVHMNIRSDNYPSLNLSEKLGFLIINQKHEQGYNIVTVGRNVINE